MQRKVKKFSVGANPQFIVLERGAVGETRDIILIPVGEEEKEMGSEIKQTIYSADSEYGFIKKVQRIKDSEIFEVNEIIDGQGLDTSVIVEFDEDLVHCSIAGVLEQNYKPEKVEINLLEKGPEIHFVDLGGDSTDKNIPEC